jgi:hypothetical protein
MACAPKLTRSMGEPLWRAHARVSFGAHAIGTQGGHAARRALVMHLCVLCSSVNSVFNSL